MINSGTLAIFDKIPQLITLLDGDIILDVNVAFCKLFLYERENLIKKSTFDLSYWENLQSKNHIDEYLKKQKKILDFPLVLKNALGQKVEVLYSGELLLCHERPTLFSTFHDVTLDNRLKRRLLKKSRYLNMAIIWEINLKKKSLYLSKEAKKILGYHSFELSPSLHLFLQLIHPHDLSCCTTQLKKYLRGDLDFFESELRIKHKKGHYLWIHIKGLSPSFNKRNFYKMMGVISNITPFKQREDEKLRLQKQKHIDHQIHFMEHVAAGIGHEINTPLTIISGHLDLLERKNPEVSEISSKMRGSIDRIKSITTILHSYLISKETIFHPCDLHTAIRNVSFFIEGYCKNNGIEFHLSLDAKSSHIEATEKQLEHIFIHLFSNAKEALIGPHKKISIRTENNNNFIITYFQDTGHGIKSEILSKVFTPFFSTRFKSIGMGLSLVQFFVLRFEGTISITSKEQEGTIVKITFPIISSL